MLCNRNREKLIGRIFKQTALMFGGGEQLVDFAVTNQLQGGCFRADQSRFSGENRFSGIKVTPISFVPCEQFGTQRWQTSKTPTGPASESHAGRKINLHDDNRWEKVIKKMAQLLAVLLFQPSPSCPVKTQIFIHIRYELITLGPLWNFPILPGETPVKHDRIEQNCCIKINVWICVYFKCMSHNTTH